MKNKKSILLCLTIIYSLNVFATAQYGDILIIGKDTSEIFSNPLENYLKQKESRIIDGQNLLMTSTACWRGYQATWLLENDSLFLIRIKKGCANWNKQPPVYLNLKNEFGKNKVFAKWVSEVIWKPEGGLIQYIHMGYASIYEKEKNYFISNGKLHSTESIENIKYEKGKLLPFERKLIDTIKKIIINNVSKEDIVKFEEKDYAFIVIKFTPDGLISSIEFENKSNKKSFFESKILEIAKSSLKDFPTLMTVNHKRYKSGYIQISISSYCLKYPDDYEYGCGR